MSGSHPTKIKATLITTPERISRLQYRFDCTFDNETQPALVCDCHTTLHFAEKNPAFQPQDFPRSCKVILSESDIGEFIYSRQPNLVWIDQIEKG